MSEMLTANHTVQDVLSNATEMAAIEAGPWIGVGDKIAADQAAVTAIDGVLTTTEAMRVTVIIGEGVKDEAPMLPHGAVYGRHPYRHFDLAVDPIDGTTQVAQGGQGGIATIALSEEGTMLPWSDINYMMKLAVGPKAAELMADGTIRVNGDPANNMLQVAHRLDKDPRDLKVAILERERNSAIIKAAHDIGAQAVLLSGCDIIPALRTAMPDDELDMLYGSGGAPETVLATAGIVALGGELQAMWHPQNDRERQQARHMGQLGEVFGSEQLVGTGETHFVLTAITSYRDMLRGVVRDESGKWHPGTTLYLTRPAL